MSMDINLGFDAASMAKITRLENYEWWLAALFQTEAMPQSLDELEQASQASMLGSFQNPTGKVETSFRKSVRSPWRGTLSNRQPYAQRLNYGFSGMTDALGRYYAYWPAYHWADNAVDMAYPYVKDIFTQAVNDAIGRVAM